jgi:hypothetical protein
MNLLPSVSSLLYSGRRRSLDPRFCGEFTVTSGMFCSDQMVALSLRLNGTAPL